MVAPTLLCLFEGYMKKEVIISEVTKIAEPLCEKLGLILYDVDFFKEGADYNLCILIDKEGDVFIEDCENLSRAIDPLLDEIDVIDCQYCLEVSSCGADRKLTKPAHFDGAVGERIEIGFYTKIDGSKKAIGVLKAHDEDTLTLEINGEDKKYNKKDISSAKVDVDYDKLFAEKNV